MKKRLPFIIATILATIFIFSNSIKSADASSISSGRFVNVIMMIAGRLGIGLFYEAVTFCVRKAAHMAEFTLQGILLANCFEMRYGRRIIYIMFFGLLTACIDEYIQLFSAGRAGMVSDIFIDFTGTLLAIAIVGISYGARRK